MASIILKMRLWKTCLWNTISILPMDSCNQKQRSISWLQLPHTQRMVRDLSFSPEVLSQVLANMLLIGLEITFQNGRTSDTQSQELWTWTCLESQWSVQMSVDSIMNQMLSSVVDGCNSQFSIHFQEITIISLVQLSKSHTSGQSLTYLWEENPLNRGWPMYDTFTLNCIMSL